MELTPMIRSGWNGATLYTERLHKSGSQNPIWNFTRNCQACGVMYERLYCYATMVIGLGEQIGQLLGSGWVNSKVNLTNTSFILLEAQVLLSFLQSKELITPLFLKVF